MTLTVGVAQANHVQHTKETRTIAMLRKTIRPNSSKLPKQQMQHLQSNKHTRAKEEQESAKIIQTQIWPNYDLIKPLQNNGHAGANIETNTSCIANFDE